MLATLNDILPKARKQKYAIGAFNINNLEIAQGVVNAAVALKSPVILQTSEGALEYAGMDYLAVIVHVAAESSRIPIVFHLDHGKNIELVLAAIESGLYSSVMFDGSSLPYEENIALTKLVVKKAHARNISVEAELGRIFGQEDTVSVQEREILYTDPDEAREFVRQTQCDALAVSIGTAHGAIKSIGKPRLDIKRLSLIAKAVSIPLVLHGASSVSPSLVTRLHTSCQKLNDCERLSGARGIPISQEKKAIMEGICKINVDTDLRIAFTVAVRETLLNDHHAYDPRTILGPARDLISEVVEEKIRLFGSMGKG